SDLRLLYSRLAEPFIGYSMKYSFNNPEGMCKTCQGLGEVKSIDINRLINFDKSLNDGAINFPTFREDGWRLTRYTESGYFDNNKKISDFSKGELDLLLYSPKIKPKKPSSSWHKTAKYFGIIPRIMESFVNVENPRYKKDLDRVLIKEICPTCHGARLSDEVLSAKIKGKSIADLTDMEINDLFDFIDEIKEGKVQDITYELKIKLNNVSKHNINNLTVKIPQNAITLVTGLAGSGKSTLIREIFKSKYPESTILDQNLPQA